MAGATLLVAVAGLNIDTIGNKFGGIPHFLPAPHMPDLFGCLALKVLPSGLTIAFLAGVESLLSATVVDGMSGDNYNSNAELIGEGVANIFSMFSAAFRQPAPSPARLQTLSPKAYSPVSGIMQSVFLLLFMLLLSPTVKYIPLACLSVILILIGWNMMGLQKIFRLLQGPRGDRYTLIVTLLLTVLVDLNTAISVGFIMASVIFMHRMSREIEIETDEQVLEEDGGGRDLTQVLHEKALCRSGCRDRCFRRRRFSGVAFLS